MTQPAPGRVQEPPEQAAAVFGDNLPLAQRFATLLCDAGVVRGLIGPREPERIWTRHLLNAAALAAWVPPHAEVVDVGSGAGLPGIPLLLARPDLRMTLLEPMARRVTFCEEARDALGLELSVQRGRAEDAPRSAADVVVARAVAPLVRLVGLTLPLLRPGGRLLALKGERAAEEVEEARPELRRAGVTGVEIRSVGEGPDRTAVVVVTGPAEALR